MYAKLIEGNLQIAPKKLIINDTQVWNASASDYLAQGWLEVIFTEMPEAPEGYYYESGWEEKDNAIVQTWELVEITDIDAEEALNIIMGGAE